VDQIRLWEIERNRVRSFNGVLYQMFARQEEYEQVLKFATDEGFKIWSSDAKRMIFVSREGHEPIKNHIRQGNLA
jgi:transcription initiation factor TFIIH subunit 4